MKRASVIGAGRFGRFVALALRQAGYEVVVADRRRVRIPGVPRVTLEEAASAPVVLLALPAGALRSVLGALAASASPGALVVNLAAVQELPARWMRQALPRSVDLVGIHALFGPSSPRGGPGGRRAVLCPVRIAPARLRRVASALGALGLSPLVATCADHDRAMARTLFVTQLVGRSLSGIVPRTGIVTANAETLGRIIAASSADSPDVLADLHRYNRHTRAVGRRVVARVVSEHARLRRAR